MFGSSGLSCSSTAVVGRCSLNHCKLSWEINGLRKSLASSTNQIANPRRFSSTGRPFWEEFRDAERSRRDWAQGTHVSKRPRERWEGEDLDILKAGVLEDLAGDGQQTSKKSSKRSSSNPAFSRSAENGISEISASTASERQETAIDPAARPESFSSLQVKISNCQSPGALLAELDPILLSVGVGGCAPGEETETDDALGALAIAVQVLGQWASGSLKAKFHRDRRVSDVLNALSDGSSSLESWALCSALRGCGLLGVTQVNVLQSLLCAVEGQLSQLKPGQIALVLRSLAFSPGMSSVRISSGLRDELISSVKTLAKELDVRETAALVPALVRLRVNDEAFTSVLAENVAGRTVGVDIHEVATAAAGLAVLRTNSSSLVAAATQMLENNVHNCTPKSIVQFCTALAERGEAHVFRSHLRPAVRTFIADFNPRDLCTIAECFVKSRAADADLLADLAHSLHAQAADMRVHELTVALNVFSNVAYAVPRLFPSVVEALRSRVDELSPRQLVRALRGLSKNKVGDAQIYAALRGRLQQLAPVVFGAHAVDALVSLADSGHLNADISKILLDIARRNLHKMSTSDHIGLLYTLSKLPPELAIGIPDGLQDDVVYVLKGRGYGPWRLELEAVVHLLEALRALRLHDEDLLELVLDRFPAALRQSNPSLTMLIQILELFADLPPRGILHVRNHLHRRHRLQSGLRRNIQRPLGKRLDIESEVVMARAFAGIGWDDQLVQDWLESVIALAPVQLESVPATVTCELCWALAELNLHRPWVRAQARRFLRSRYPQWAAQHPNWLPMRQPGEKNSDDESERETQGAMLQEAGSASSELTPDALLRFAWALAVLGERVPGELFVELHRLFDGRLPSDWTGKNLKLFQEIAFDQSLLHTKSPEVTDEELEDIPTDIREWLMLAREVPREDLYSRMQPPRHERRSQKVSTMPWYPYEQWLSVTLSQLHIPHEAGKAVNNVHRVAVAFPKQKQVIDVLSHSDMSVPGCRPLGSAELRRRHLQQVGWGLHTVSLRELHEAMRRGKLKLFVSKMLNTFDPDAARGAGSFRSSTVRGSQGRMRVLENVLTKMGISKRQQSFENDGSDDEDMDSMGSLRPKDPSAALHERARQAVRNSGTSAVSGFSDRKT